jgi:hypothetical protein
LGGAFTRPVQRDILSQAACSLPTIGGTASCQLGKTDFEGMISFDSAHTRVTGGVDDHKGEPHNVTSSSVVIENLNILDVVRVDRVVARLTGRHAPKTDAQVKKGVATEPEIITSGCYFEGLRISGQTVQVETDHDLFFQLPTYRHWQNAWKAGNALGKRAKASLMGSSLGSPAQTEPHHLQEIRHGHKTAMEATVLLPTVLSSFVKKAVIARGAGTRALGPIITIPHFGTIYLGEVVVSFGHRRVHMMRLEPEFPESGNFIIGTAGGNGTPYP